MKVRIETAKEELSHLIEFDYGMVDHCCCCSNICSTTYIQLFDVVVFGQMQSSQIEMVKWRKQLSILNQSSLQRRPESRGFYSDDKLVYGKAPLLLVVRTYIPLFIANACNQLTSFPFFFGFDGDHTTSCLGHLQT